MSRILLSSAAVTVYFVLHHLWSDPIGFERSIERNETKDATISLHDQEKKPITCTYSGTGLGYATCIDPVGIPGEWVNVGKNRTFDAPLKRGSSGGGACGHGLMRSTPALYHGVAGVPMTSHGSKCDCPDFEDEYVWTSPETGLAPAFDAEETSDRLGSRMVMFVGDSTSQQTASTLMNALGSAGCHTQVYSALSDTLVGGYPGKVDRGRRWHEWVNQFSPTLHAHPDIVVLSVGAHIAGKNDTFYAEVVDRVLDEADRMRGLWPGIVIAWKTQNPGTCMADAVSPANATEAFESSPRWHHRWNYNRFRDRDLILLSKLQERGIPYLDMRMLYSRADGHVSSRMPSRAQQDCLHMCIPGPLDVIARLFDRLLRSLDDK